MNEHDARRIISQEMNNHGLIDLGWTWRWDRAVKRMGCCDHAHHRLTFSRGLFGANDEDRCRDTVLHEIAHALVGPGHGHGVVWQRKCREIGGNARARYTHEDTTTLPPRWVGTCAADCRNSGKWLRDRLSQKARHGSCGRCRTPINWRQNVAAFA